MDLEAFFVADTVRDMWQRGYRIDKHGEVRCVAHAPHWSTIEWKLGGWRLCDYSDMLRYCGAHGRVPVCGPCKANWGPVVILRGYPGLDGKQDRQS